MRALRAALATVLLAVFVLVGMVPGVAAATPAALAVSIDRPLSLVGDSLAVTVRGKTASALQGGSLAISIRGPAALSQLRQQAPVLPEVGEVVIALGEASSGNASSAGSEGVSYQLGSAGDLVQGTLEARVSLPGNAVPTAGAYLLVAEVRLPTGVVALGQAWMGKVAPREEPIDLALVWPVFAGIHRDAEGVFFDETLEELVACSPENESDLRTLLLLPERFPSWSFTLVPEPVLLAQLRDMADGYLRHGDQGAKAQVTKEDTAAQQAKEVLQLFQGAASRSSVEVAVAPFALPDLGALAAQNWRDGLEQVQWGKREVLQTLGLQSPPRAGCPFGLSLTSDSLSCFAEASIDLVVADRGLLGLMAEPVPETTVAVRVRNARNDRATLLLASSGLSSLVDEPWDVGVFCAGLAAELAEKDRGALVVAPCRKYGLIPGDFLKGLGEVIVGSNWLRTRTLTSLAEDQLADTRPLLLDVRYAPGTGYIEETLWNNLEEAHTAVTTLGSAADPVHDPLATAYRWLYLAESSWWTRDGVTPFQASVGVEYAKTARSLVEDELSKLQMAAVDSPTVLGHEGAVKLVVDNGTGYPLRAEIKMDGDGLVFPGGETVSVELRPGLNTFEPAVKESKGAHRLEARLLVGGSVLAEASASVRFITMQAALPWLILGVVLLATAVYAVVRGLGGKHRVRVG